MIMDFLMGMVNKFLDFVIDSLNKVLDMLKIDVFVDELMWLISLIKGVNVMLPIKELLWVLGFMCTFAFMSLVFWCVQKLFEMIRG